jgi:hypothetical protein
VMTGWKSLPPPPAFALPFAPEWKAQFVPP